MARTVCTLYADRTTINRRNVAADPAKAYRADRDFFLVVVQSRVIAAAMEILGIQSKSSRPYKCPIPPGVGNMSNQAKLQYLHKVAAMIVDSFVFDQSSVNHLVDKILTAQEKEDAINSQQLTEDGRFPCRFPGCNYSFQYDGRSRRRHELTHNVLLPSPLGGGVQAVYMYIHLSFTFHLDFYYTVSFRLCCLQVSTITLIA